MKQQFAPLGHIILIKVSHSFRFNGGIQNTTQNLLGPSWPWSYGNWFNNYLCNQCLSPL